jgi:hypothetical protein
VSRAIRPLDLSVRIALLGALLVVGIAAVAVVDHNRTSSRITSDLAHLYPCDARLATQGVSETERAARCEGKYVAQRWRSRRAWYVLGGFAVIVFSGVGAYASRRPRAGVPAV